ncbi:hypothetical protein ACIQUQ_04710 [Streptomyces sp. NPDC101118]|uniref:hypothetical protein n=1 Tax=Streptomyces sp. NPDC101118 TaxID=3366109 RepID=UPI00381DBFC1
MSGTGSGSGRGAGRRPWQVEAAWRLTLAACAAEAVVWVLGAFVVEPTGLDDMTAAVGAGAAARQLALSGAVSAVLLAAWIAVAAYVRAGRGWARIVLTAAAAVALLARATDLGMDGTVPGGWALLAALPDLLGAAAVVPLHLPAAHAHFRRRPPAAA